MTASESITMDAKDNMHRKKSGKITNPATLDLVANGK